jgi:hypothetical protein
VSTSTPLPSTHSPNPLARGGQQPDHQLLQLARRQLIEVGRPQVVSALVVTPDDLPLACEALSGNTADCKTLRMFLAKIERQYGRARRVWVIDRGIPTEALLAELRGSDPSVPYLVGAPKGRLSRLEKQPLTKPWQEPVRVSRSNSWPRTTSFMRTQRASIASARACRGEGRGTCDAQATAQVAMEAASRVGRHGNPA